MKNHVLLYTALAAYSFSFSQNLPFQWTLDDENHRLIIGGVEHTGLYDENNIKEIYLTFDQADYEELLEENYDDAIAIPASITVDGVTYTDVGARYKGQTSYFQNMQIRSLSILQWMNTTHHSI